MVFSPWSCYEQRVNAQKGPFATAVLRDEATWTFRMAVLRASSATHTVRCPIPAPLQAVHLPQRSCSYPIWTNFSWCRSMGGWLAQTRVDVRRQMECPKTCGLEDAGEEVARSQAIGYREHRDCGLVGIVRRMRGSYDFGKQGG